MKILIIGSKISYRSPMFFFRAFKSLGMDTKIFDDEEYYWRHLSLIKNRYTHRLFWKTFSLSVNKELIRTVNKAKPDMLFIIKGWFYSPKTLREIKATSQALIFIFNPDDPFSLNLGSSSEFIRNSISIYDAYFIWSKTLVSKLKDAGAKMTEYLPFGYDPALHYPVAVAAGDSKVFGSNITFVGNWDQEREKWLSGLEGYNLALWGTDYWKTRCRNKFLKSSWKHGVAFGDKWSRVCLASDINLNILRPQNKGGHNTRTFEIPACGGFMLHERSDEALEFFKEGKEAEYYSSIEELKDKINFYLSNSGLRIRIARAGYERCIKSGYSYTSRVEHIMTVYEKMRLGA